MPLIPLLASKISAVPPVCRANAELNEMAPGALAEDDVVVLDVDLLEGAAELVAAEPELAGAAGAVGRNELFVGPKPTLAA